MPTCHFIKIACAFCMIVSSLLAATYTVSKGGSANFTTIQAAIDSAGMGDEVIIKDFSVYEEQLTIDSTKGGLILRSENPMARIKPTILYQDRGNVGPATCADAKDTSKITFRYNGVLRIIGASSVRVEGIAIDGGGVYPFGYDGIWSDGGTCRWPNQHGNTAICMYQAGDAIVRDCDIKNAFFGLYILDRNEGGAFARPGDLSPGSMAWLSWYGRTGNHLIEHNRIHDNSFGLFFESAWDVGSTIRYNLIYENHHPTGAIAQQVKGLTTEGPNLPGGAFLFKDDPLSPLSIYNNTFWHNMFLFVGNWHPSGVHLIFNNIFGEPFTYWGEEPVFGGNVSQEMSPVFTNRMNSCVFAAQQERPTADYVSIMNNMGQPKAEGDLIPATYPAFAKVRWLETKFKSIDPAGAAFLMPDWANPLVKQFIIDGGWEAAGVRDADGTPADLGAVSQEGGRPVDVVTIRPTKPVFIYEKRVSLAFNITQRIGKMTDPKVTFLRFIKNLDTISTFGNDCPVVAAADIIALPIPSSPPTIVGTNEYAIDIPVEVRFGELAFFELIAEGAGADGRPFTTATGFIPFRNIGYLLEAKLLNREKTAEIYETRCGEPVVLRATAMRIDGVLFDKPVDPTAINLQSRFHLLTPDGSKVTSVPGGITGSVDMEVMFSRVPIGGIEYVMISGKWVEGNRVLAFLASSDAIKIRPGPADSIQFQDPPSGMTAKVDPGTTYPVKVQAFDKFGNKVDSAYTVNCISTKPDIGNIVVNDVQTDTTGMAVFRAQVINGKLNDTFPIVATIGNGGMTDRAYLVCCYSASVNHAPALSFPARAMLCELIDLRGRVVKRIAVYKNPLPGRNPSFAGSIGNGMYLVRMTDIATGKVTMQPRMLLTR